MKHNSFASDIPIIVVMKVSIQFILSLYYFYLFIYFYKALTVESDQEIVQLIGSEPMYLNGISGSLEQCSKLQIYSREQALVC